MRIPLDYYRILGLPIQATAEQLQQAYRDRTLQLPRREYSEAAIAARKDLIDEAYLVLSDANQRRVYDSSFLAGSVEAETGKLNGSDLSATATLVTPASANGTDPYTPKIEIQDHQLVGALLILLELGEYELVVRLGRPYLSSGSSNLQDGRYGDPSIVLADIALTIASACLELGREQWQQGQYENAAESLEAGQELLLREGVFLGLRGEMQADLDKLRPYRILEMLSLPEHTSGYEQEHRKGLDLLQDMLQERGGIDGSGDDQSGLSVDDFLKFTQQLRSYLTAAEQQTLFESEARRPSAVATYLAVYALIARGFAERQPALIRRAKLMLVRLGVRQDVYLERALCALLLGQTEEANRALELSQEHDSLAFIREHSKDSPDLLPGLCLYGERWLQNEVFPHFRDLSRQQASLKEYFADEQVQAYLEELPNEPEAANHWSTASTAAIASHGQRDTSALRNRSAVRDRTDAVNAVTQSTTASATATLDSESNPVSANGVTSMPAAERVSQSSRTGNNGHRSSPSSARGSRSQQMQERQRSSPATGVPKPAAATSRRSSTRSSLRLDRLAFLAAIGLGGLLVLGFALNRISRALSSSDNATLPSTTTAAAASEVQAVPLALIPRTIEPLLKAQLPAGQLSDDAAKQIVESWLTAKAAALGEQHDIDQLAQILIDPALSERQLLAQQMQQQGQYVQYQHTVTVESVTVDEATPEQASVEATVTEKAEVYKDGGDLIENSDDTVRVRYNLIQQDGQWRIQSMTVL